MEIERMDDSSTMDESYVVTFKDSGRGGQLNRIYVMLVVVMHPM
jgi:hypothetical protein